MIDEITSQAVLRMFLDGLSVDEVLVAIPTLLRSDIERVQRRADAERRQQKRLKENLDRQMSPWEIK